LGNFALVLFVVTADSREALFCWTTCSKKEAPERYCKKKYFCLVI